MDNYACAYRDEKSPLTPITPVGRCFEFPPLSKDFKETNRLYLHETKNKGTSYNIESRSIFLPPNRGSLPDFTETFEGRQVISSKMINSGMHLCASNKENICNTNRLVKSSACCKKPLTPIRCKPLSPRVGRILKHIGMSKYEQIFEHEEIDYVVLASLTEKDLLDIGVLPQCERYTILQAIRNLCTNLDFL